MHMLPFQMPNIIAIITLTMSYALPLQGFLNHYATKASHNFT